MELPGALHVRTWPVCLTHCSCPELSRPHSKSRRGSTPFARVNTGTSSHSKGEASAGCMYGGTTAPPCGPTCLERRQKLTAGGYRCRMLYNDTVDFQMGRHCCLLVVKMVRHRIWIRPGEIGYLKRLSRQCAKGRLEAAVTTEIVTWSSQIHKHCKTQVCSPIV